MTPPNICLLYTSLQTIVDRLNHVVQEGVTAIRAVKAFVRGAVSYTHLDVYKRQDLATAYQSVHVNY